MKHMTNIKISVSQKKSVGHRNKKKKKNEKKKTITPVDFFLVFKIDFRRLILCYPT